MLPPGKGEFFQQLADAPGWAGEASLQCAWVLGLVLQACLGHGAQS